jgi:hypothetical protein
MASGSRKRKQNPHWTNGDIEYDANINLETSEVLRELGYLPGHQHFQLEGFSDVSLIQIMFHRPRTQSDRVAA